MLKIKITPKAESDLENIWKYTSTTWGETQADQYLDQLESGMQHLISHPDLGVDYSHIRSGYRRLRIEHHDLYYRVQEKEILVIRVLHEEMDAPKRLLE